MLFFFIRLKVIKGAVLCHPSRNSIQVGGTINLHCGFTVGTAKGVLIKYAIVFCDLFRGRGVFFERPLPWLLIYP